MNQQRQSVIVMDSDPQVLKGLSLLLEDMQFNVIPARHQDKFGNIKPTQDDCPVLLILPLKFANGGTSCDLVKTLRADFQQCIPAILLSHENGFSPDHFIHEDIVVLSDRISPKDLRRNISTLLSKEPVV